MGSQGELFAAPPIVPGLVLVGRAVSEAEERALEAHIDAAPLAPFQFGQWEGKRLTVHYGSAYDFGRQRLDPAPPLPDWLVAARERLAPQVGRDPAAFQAALQTNLTVIATAHAVSEGIIRGVSGELARQQTPSTYGAGGRATAPAAKTSQPLAISRTL